MAWGTIPIAFPWGQTATINIDALPTTQRPNIVLPNVNADDAGKLSRIELPGLYIDPAEYNASGPLPRELTLYRSLSGDNQNHQAWRN